MMELAHRASRPRRRRPAVGCARYRRDAMIFMRPAANSEVGPNAFKEA